MSVRVRQSWALRTRPGNSIIEVIIAMALLLMFTIAFLQMSMSGSNGDFRARKMSETTAYARQGLEAVRSIGEQDFQQLTIGNHGIGVVSGVYAFSGSTNVANGYTRTVTVGLVQRNGAGDIVQSGGDIDYDTRSVVATVEWMEGSHTRNTSLTTYLTDWRKILQAGLTVQKIVINHGGSKLPADFAPYLVGTGTVALGEATSLTAGTYTVYETTDPNYIQSFGGDCDASGTVTLDAGDSKTCTITNEEKRATVTVNKTVVNHGGTKVAADFAPYKVGTTIVTLGSGTTINTGTYAVSEVADANYLQTFSGDCDTAGQIILAYDDVKICTITNEEKVLPVVTTPTVTSITTNSAILSANVTSLGFPASISARGTCWGTTPAPTTNCVAEGGTTTGVFSHARTGLTSGTTYYFRGYATNSVGTAYSPDGTFTTVATTNGVLMYSDGTAIPKFRTYTATTDTFSIENSIANGAAGRKFILRTSPSKQEAIAGYYGAAGVLDIFCYNGSTWTKEWSVSIGGDGTRRRFDISYETNSGDAIVFYSRNVSGSNEMGYRTKAGSTSCGSASWSGETAFNPVRTSGIVQWIKLAWDRRASSNLIAAQWADANSDLSAAIWNGSSWVNEPATVTETALEVLSTAHDLEDFDIEYESVSGDVMMVWANAAGANGTNGVRYRTCTGGTATCSWGSVITPPTFADDATTMDISAHPTSDEIVFASVGNAGNDLQLGYWNGTTWTNTANADTSCNAPVAIAKMVTTGWLTVGGISRSIVVYGDQGSNSIDWFTGSSGVFTQQTDVLSTPAPINPNYTINIQMNPVSPNQLMYLLADSNNDLFAKRLTMNALGIFTWTNSDGAALETTLPQSTNDPFSFAFWRQ